MASDDSDELKAVAPEDGEGGDDKKGGKKKLIIIIVAALLLLIGGGGAGLYFTGMLDKILHKGDAKTEGGKEAGKDGEKKEGKDGEGAEAASFLQIPDMLVNLSGTEGQSRYLRLSVQLELANEVDKAAVEAVLPRVIDQFQTYLRELRVKDLRGSAGIYRLQMELLTRVNTAAAPTKVKDVLFQEILIQ